MIIKLFLVIAYAATLAPVRSTARNSELCPPPDAIEPCKCFVDPQFFDSLDPVTLCSDFTNAIDISQIFDRNKGWNLYYLQVSNSTMNYIPATMVENAYFKYLRISSTTLVSLFDVTPVSSPEMTLELKNTKVLRGFQWSSLSHLNLTSFYMYDMNVKHFGKDFKDNFPKSTKIVTFSNTKTVGIKDQAFSGLENAKRLEISNGLLKSITRDMFPRPWNVRSFDFSNQKLSVLPNDIFDDMPNLRLVGLSSNLFTALPREIFKQYWDINLYDNPINCDCDLKWITSVQPWIRNINGQCKKPDKCNGTDFMSLTEADFRYCQ